MVDKFNFANPMKIKSCRIAKERSIMENARILSGYALYYVNLK